MRNFRAPTNVAPQAGTNSGKPKSGFHSGCVSYKNKTLSAHAGNPHDEVLKHSYRYNINCCLRIMLALVGVLSCNAFATVPFPVTPHTLQPEFAAQFFCVLHLPLRRKGKLKASNNTSKIFLNTYKSKYIVHIII